MIDLNSRRQDDDLLEQVTGGKQPDKPVTVNVPTPVPTPVPGGIVGNAPTKSSLCPNCNTETTFILGSGGRAVCKDCGFEKLM